MPRVEITTTDGEQHTVACPGVNPEDIDVAYIEQRTSFDVESVEVTPEVEDRVTQLEQAAGVGGTGKNGIAHRIDDLEQRISDLEDQV